MLLNHAVVPFNRRSLNSPLCRVRLPQPTNEVSERDGLSRRARVVVMLIDPQHDWLLRLDRCFFIVLIVTALKSFTLPGPPIFLMVEQLITNCPHAAVKLQVPFLMSVSGHKQNPFGYGP